MPYSIAYVTYIIHNRHLASVVNELIATNFIRTIKPVLATCFFRYLAVAWYIHIFIPMTIWWFAIDKRDCIREPSRFIRFYRQCFTFCNETTKYWICFRKIVFMQLITKKQQNEHSIAKTGEATQNPGNSKWHISLNFQFIFDMCVVFFFTTKKCKGSADYIVNGSARMNTVSPINGSIVFKRL